VRLDRDHGPGCAASVLTIRGGGYGVWALGSWGCGVGAVAGIWPRKTQETQKGGMVGWERAVQGWRLKVEPDHLLPPPARDAMRPENLDQAESGGLACLRPSRSCPSCG
jgi:hypothetical protein